MPPSDTYTHGHHESVLRSHRWRTAENSARYLLEHLSPGLELLDVGCGPGTLTAELAKRVAPGRAIGIDRVPSIVEEARSPVASGPANLEFAVGDAYSLDFADASFDVVHAHQLLQHLSDPVAALREWARVLRPGGLLAARDSDYEAFTWFPEKPQLDRWLALYRSAARSNRAEPDAGRRLLSWARAAGLGEVAASASVWCFATPGDRGWWSGLWAERITQSSLAEQLRSSGLATGEELADIAAAWQRWASHDDAWFLVPHGEILCRIA